MSFLELLQPQGDKATLNEIIEVKKLLPSRVVANIPACLYDGNGDLDEEVLVILCTILARRENKDMTTQEVGDRIGNQTADLLEPIIKDLLYFYTTNTKEEIEERYADAQEDAPEQEVSEPVEDPTE